MFLLSAQRRVGGLRGAERPLVALPRDGGNKRAIIITIMLIITITSISIVKGLRGAERPLVARLLRPGDGPQARAAAQARGPP